MGVIKIGSKSCSPCILAGKKLNDLGVEYTELDAFEDEIVDAWNVRSIPTIIKTDSSGNEEFRLIGKDCLDNEKLSKLK